MNRVRSLRNALESRGIDGILVSERKNIRYLSGFQGSAGLLLITDREKVLFTDFRYEEEVRTTIHGYEIVIERDSFPKSLVEKVRSAGMQTLGFESTVSYSFYRSLLRKGFRLKALSNVIEDLRKIKDRDELGLISLAADRAQRAFQKVLPYIRPGATERTVAVRLEENLKKEGCKSLPFDIIVAAGKNSAMPHARPSDYIIKAGDFVVIDWGGEAEGYFSDMTRTFLMEGRNISKKIEMYDTVLQANRKAIEAAAEGIHASAVDRTARDVIRKAGYGDFFGHGTGHGVGLDVHELPRISRLGREYVKAGMVFTVEPGVYVPGLGGVRIEDMVLAEKKGRTVLTTLPKDLKILHKGSGGTDH